MLLFQRCPTHMLSQEKSESPAPAPPMPHEISAMTIRAHLSERDDMGLLKNGSFHPLHPPPPPQTARQFLECISNIQSN